MGMNAGCLTQRPCLSTTSLGRTSCTAPPPWPCSCPNSTLLPTHSCDSVPYLNVRNVSYWVHSPNPFLGPNVISSDSLAFT